MTGHMLQCLLDQMLNGARVRSGDGGGGSEIQLTKCTVFRVCCLVLSGIDNDDPTLVF